MKADNRDIKKWMDAIRSGALRLPEFQRGEVWNHQLVGNFLEAILRDRPLGIFLILDVNPADPPFETKPIARVENDRDKCREHLLDGQQRLVALWRSFSNEHEDGRVFYVGIDDNTVVGVKGSSRNKWIGIPKEEFQEGYIPVAILQPGEAGLKKSYQWKKQVATDTSNERLDVRVEGLREKFSQTEIPFLSMPMETSREDAIETFVEVNQSSMRLKGVDIAVAEYMSKTSDALLNLVEEMKKDLDIAVFEDADLVIGDWILKAACVHQGIKPTNSYNRLDFESLKRDWAVLLNGFDWTVRFLKEEHIWHDRLLPNVIPFRVLPALHSFFEKKKRDKRSQAKRLIKSYLWRCFTTDWYTRQANDRLFKDFKVLKSILESENFQLSEKDKEKTIFDDEHLPDAGDILRTGWPKPRGLGRAILAMSAKNNACDMETGDKISLDNIKVGDWESHHIFPKRLLRTNAKDENRDLALNCMLLKSTTNKAWSSEWPGDYLMERVKEYGLEGVKAEKAIKSRLESHCIPTDVIMKAKKSAKEDLAKIYQSFLRERAEMVRATFQRLCKGEDL